LPKLEHQFTREVKLTKGNLYVPKMQRNERKGS
jgi:hypothetical protein